MPIEETEEYIHYRVKNPDRFHKASFRVITLDKNIKATIGCPKTATYTKGKCQDGTQIQKLMFPKDKWTRKRAVAWLKKHPKIKARKKT